LFYQNEQQLAKRLVDLEHVWPKSSKLIQSKNKLKIYNKYINNLIHKDIIIFIIAYICFNRIEKNLKKKICTILDETSNHSKNWRMLAQTLAINRYTYIYIYKFTYDMYIFKYVFITLCCFHSSIFILILLLLL
jgi:hypothetical protein